MKPINTLIIIGNENYLHVIHPNHLESYKKLGFREATKEEIKKHSDRTKKHSDRTKKQFQELSEFYKRLGND